MLGKMKDMYQFQRQAKQIQKELKSMNFQAQSSNGNVTVNVNGEMTVKDIELQNLDQYADRPEKLARELTDTVNKAVQKAQKTSAEKMRSVMGDMGLPGM